MTADPRIDAYIARAAGFARPLLVELRARVHAACPDAVETLKWGAPSFTYNGKLLALMAAFKQHVSFNLWHDDAAPAAGERDGMGQFGRLEQLADLPPKRALGTRIRAAMARIDAGEPVRARSAPRAPLPVPDDLRAALSNNVAAQAAFDGFPPGKRREYIEWLLDAKHADTRARRLQQAVEWIAEGKARNWKYAR